MQVRRVTMTPAYAEELLALNTHNRNMSESYRDTLADDIVRGLYKENPDPIKVSTAPRSLLDGQHRLSAVIKADKTVTMWIAEDCPHEIAPVLDNGRRRTAADILNMRGHTSGVGLATAARMAINYLSGYHFGRQVSTARIDEFISQNPDLASWFSYADKARTVFAPGPLGAVAFLATRDPLNIPRMSEFLDGVISGANLGEGDGRLVLRESARRARDKQIGNGAPPTAWSMSTATKCWNAFVEGRTITQVRYSKSRRGAFAVQEVIGAPDRARPLAKKKDAE